MSREVTWEARNRSQSPFHREIGACSFGAWVVAALVVAVAGVQVDAQQRIHPDAEAFELRPGVIVDPSRDTLYLMAHPRGVEAIELETGRVLWRTDEADKPLLAQEDLLIAQADSPSNSMQLVVFDLGRSKTPLFRADVELPPGIIGSVDDGMERSLTTRARFHAQDPLVSWDFRRRSVSGVAPDPAESYATDKAGGVIRIDLEAETAETLPQTGRSFAEALVLPSSVQDWIDSNDRDAIVGRVGETLALTHVEKTADGRSNVILRRWSATSGEPLPALTLFEGDLRARSIAADGRHTLLSRSSSVGESEARYVWAIYSLRTGRRLGEVPGRVSTAPFFVRGTAFVHESVAHGRRVGEEWTDTPVEIRAVDIATGSRLWGRPLRDTSYKGPYPPGSLEKDPSPVPSSSPSYR